jgi:hypothetical protein
MFFLFERGSVSQRVAPSLAPRTQSGPSFHEQNGRGWSRLASAANQQRDCADQYDPHRI